MALFGKKKEKQAGSCCGDVTAESMAEAQKAKDGGAAVKVLGSGCKKCIQLEENTKTALSQLGKDTTVDHITDFAQIAAYGVMTTPALVINGKVVLLGKVAPAEEIAELIQKSGI